MVDALRHGQLVPLSSPPHFAAQPGAVQWRQPSLSNSILKLPGSRGISPSAGRLQRGTACRRRRTGRAWSPCHGRPECSSQTHPQPWHWGQFILFPRGCNLIPAQAVLLNVHCRRQFAIVGDRLLIRVATARSKNATGVPHYRLHDRALQRVFRNCARSGLSLVCGDR